MSLYLSLPYSCTRTLIGHSHVCTLSLIHANNLTTLSDTHAYHSSLQDYGADSTPTSTSATSSTSTPPMVIDLHGYSMPLARASVRSALDMLKKEAAIDKELKLLEGEGIRYSSNCIFFYPSLSTFMNLFINLLIFLFIYSSIF